MQASQIYDDVEAVIMAAEEHPEYCEEIIDSFIEQVLRRRKRRFSTWHAAALLFGVGILGTLFVDRFISFPLSLFAFLFLWTVIIATWGTSRLIAMAERNATRFALMWLLTRTALRRGMSRGIFDFLTLSLVRAGLKRLVKGLAF